MRFYRAKIILLTSILVVGLLNSPARADTPGLVTAADKTTGYSRALFKHWIDSDKDGCNTRAEVLIEEAITKPKVGAKCTLAGGKWLSAYDGKYVTKSSDLDVDHMVPLAEAWRSGAWKWSSAQRQAYANDLEDARALIAVTLSTNRSKGDKDPALWLPAKEQCSYVENWIAIKTKYSLTVDSKEAKKLNELISSCGLNVSKSASALEVPTPIVTFSNVKYYGEEFVLTKILVTTATEIAYPRPYQSGFSITSNSKLVTPGKITIKCFRGPFNEQQVDQNIAGGIYLPSGINTELYIPNNPGEDIVSCLLTPTLTFNVFFTYRANGNSNGEYLKQSAKFEIAATTPASIPQPSPTLVPESIVTPGAFCSPAGAIGNSSAGVTYTCKTSPTDTRNRWRQ